MASKLTKYVMRMNPTISVANISNPIHVIGCAEIVDFMGFMCVCHASHNHGHYNEIQMGFIK